MTQQQQYTTQEAPLKRGPLPLHTASRAAEAHEMLDRPPAWLLRWGNLSLVLVFGLLLGAGMLIRYPDTIEGKAVITTDPLPIRLKAPVAGRISSLFAADGKNLQAGAPVAELENNTGYRNILQLRDVADSAAACLARAGSAGWTALLERPLYALGEAQPYYNALLQHISAYVSLQQEHIYERRAANLAQQRRRYRSVAGVTHAETQLVQEELQQAAERFAAQEKLYKERVISRAEYFEEAAKLRQRRLTLEAQQKSLLQQDITEGNNDKEFLEMAYDKAEKIRTVRIAIGEATRNLQNFMQTWQRQYLLAAPYHGKVRYLRPLQLNEPVQGGEALFAMIPAHFHHMAYLQVPAAGLGKVAPGQNVHLLPDKYPYQEFGYLEGKVAAVSELPQLISTKDGQEQVYRITVQLGDSLRTSYRRLLPFSPEMPAAGRIITHDKSLLQRLLAGILAVRK